MGVHQVQGLRQRALESRTRGKELWRFTANHYSNSKKTTIRETSEAGGKLCLAGADLSMSNRNIIENREIIENNIPVENRDIENDRKSSRDVVLDNGTPTLHAISRRQVTEADDEPIRIRRVGGALWPTPHPYQPRAEYSACYLEWCAKVGPIVSLPHFRTTFTYWVIITFFHSLNCCISCIFSGNNMDNVDRFISRAEADAEPERFSPLSTNRTHNTASAGLSLSFEKTSDTLRGGFEEARTRSNTARESRLHQTELVRIATHHLVHSSTVGTTDRQRTRRYSEAKETLGAGKLLPTSTFHVEDFLVEFDGSEDPLHAHNWPLKKKCVSSLIPDTTG